MLSNRSLHPSVDVEKQLASVRQLIGYAEVLLTHLDQDHPDIAREEAEHVEQAIADGVYLLRQIGVSSRR